MACIKVIKESDKTFIFAEEKLVIIGPIIGYIGYTYIYIYLFLLNFTLTSKILIMIDWFVISLN